MREEDQFGRDLLAAVRRGEGSLRGQLEAQLREDVRAGRLRPDEALPGSRSLAAALGVSRGVVVEAYAQLAAEGFLVTRPGGTTRVAARPAPAPAPPVLVAPPLIAPAPGGATSGGFPSDLGGRTPAATVGGGGARYDLRAESADRGAFPRRAWAAAVRRSLVAAPEAVLGYGDLAGLPELRAALAGFLGRSRGTAAGPEQVVVCSGAVQALGLVVGALRDAGEVTRVGVEDPGFPVHREVLRRTGVELVRLPVDDRGLTLDGLDRVDAVLVTPAHQMPTGVVLAPERRSGLAAWGGWILEDDYDGELRYERERLGALQGLRPDRTVYLGTASKVLAPGLRLGWLLAPPALARAVAERRGFEDGGQDVIGQLALADLIATGALDRHLRRMRARYRRRRDALLAAVARELPDATVTGAAVGLHVLVRLPPGEPARPVVAAARARGLALGGFELDGHAVLLLGFGNLAEPAIDPALRALAAARAGALAAPGRQRPA